MSVLPPDRVYTGFWIDHLRGDVLGSTITISAEAANVVVAVLSVLITFAGSYLWDIVAFCYFMSCASASPQDGLHHQKQFLLRNATSPATVLFKTIEMYWRWRGRVKRPLSRLIHLAVVTIICGVGFVVAGILSSQIVSSSGIEVLAQSSQPGFLITDRTNKRLAGNLSLLSQQYSIGVVDTSFQYVRNCYNGSDENPSCRIYVNQEVPFRSDYSSCPFEGMCILDKNSGLVMDTGLSSSDTVFGINTKPQDSIALRQVTTCAPLNVSQYTTGPVTLSNSSTQDRLGRDAIAGEQFYQWNLGKEVGKPYNDTWYLSTHKIASVNSFSYFTSEWIQDGPLQPNDMTFFVVNYFTPIAQLLPKDADLVLYGITSNSRVYSYPVNDPVFSAHQPRIFNYQELQSNGTRSNGTELYYADQPAGWVGCKEQYQFCLPTGECTSLTGGVNAITQAVSFDLTPMQNVTLYSFINVIANFGASVARAYMGDQVLLAAEADSTFGVPSNQWELEVKNWFAVKQAFIQHIMADVAAGAGRSGSKFDVLPKISPGPSEATLWHSQKMMAPDGFSNLSVFGLAFTVGVSGFIILASLALPRVLRLTSRSNRNMSMRIEKWDREELLEFQRIAFESNRLGTWTGPSHHIPITTTPHQKFLSLVDTTSAVRSPNTSTSPVSSVASGATLAVTPSQCTSNGARTV